MKVVERGKNWEERDKRYEDKGWSLEEIKGIEDGWKLENRKIKRRRKEENIEVVKLEKEIEGCKEKEIERRKDRYGEKGRIEG